MITFLMMVTCSCCEQLILLYPLEDLDDHSSHDDYDDDDDDNTTYPLNPCEDDQDS